MKILDENRIKYLLRNRAKLLHYIRRQRELLYREVAERDRHLADVILKSKTYDDVRVQGGRGENEILLKVLEDEKRMEREEILALQDKLKQLMSSEEEINRIWICFRELPYQQSLIVEHLYVNGEKFSYVEKELDMGHKIFCTQRKNAIDFMQRLFHSPYTNRELIQKVYQEKKKQTVPVQGKKKSDRPERTEISGQMNLFDYENKENK